MIDQYIKSLDKRFRTGISTEHTYRGDLQRLLEDLCPGILVTNEPARVACGAPDYILTRKNIPTGYIEAKDIDDQDLDGKAAHKEQFDRYRNSLNNIIFTDYLNFRLYRNGEFVAAVSIAHSDAGRIKPLSDRFDEFKQFINEFISFSDQSIKSPRKLAEMMAGKARMLANIIENAIISDEDDANMANELANNTLREQMQAFQQVLIHDIMPNEFADIYAQTIAYGMFAARLYDPTLDDFSRQEAAELIPKSNPFLRKLFQYIAGYDLDDRIKWIVDALADVFRATDVGSLLKNFGTATQQNDPMIHFYETFLGAYNPKLRKARGVWYTPEPVVNFIVRAVDDILKEEFGLSEGFADTSKTKIMMNTQTPDKRSKTGFKQVEQEVHKVQILDPAAGTGTFLAEVIKQIYKKFENQQGIWSNYVENHLIPRLNGFELLMASYAMAHLKLEMLLAETGYTPKKAQRLKVFLTNSLEEHHPDTGTLFANWLSTEANEANHIKRDTPVMCVIGNPPYSVSSSNKSEWIEKLMYDYKKDLNERNINPLSDDYLKFIRYGQYFIEKNGEGVLAYISNNSFIDGIIHRQMRKHLLETFDDVYILDLHGSSKKKEIAPNGGKDENVFDIMQGVSINIFIKKSNSKKLAQLKQFDLYGKRDIKYSFLNEASLSSIKWNNLESHKPDFFYIQKDYKVQKQYSKGFSSNDLFIKGSSGIKTERDSLTIQFTKQEIAEIKNDLLESDVEEFRKRYNERKDGRDWKLELAKKDLQKNNPELIKIHYRPFDTRYTYYTGTTKGFQAYPRNEITPNFYKNGNNNIGIIHLRLNFEIEKYVTLLTKQMTEKGSLVCGNYFISPLYVYPNQSEDGVFNEEGRKPNLNTVIVKQIAEKLELVFTNEKEETENTFAPIDIVDYIYAVLYSPTYRERYKEFLKIDFPRVPYPKDTETFWQMVKLGGELRQLHLMESPLLTKYQTRYPHDGDNRVNRKINKKDWELYDPVEQKGRVWINDQQCFENIPLIAWEFYIGGYQPAQKWLKDRHGRQLDYDDIMHYHKIITALSETDRIMKEIDEVDFL